eukprot:s4490_g5.t1
MSSAGLGCREPLQVLRYGPLPTAETPAELPVYQASLAELYLRSPASPPPEDPDGGRRSSVAAAEAQQVFGGLRSSQAMEKAASQKEDEWEGWSNRDKAKFQRKGETAGKGGWQSWTSNKRKEPTNKTSGTEEAASLDTATQSLIQSMTRLVLRHESELSNLRREMGYMLFIDTEQYSCLETLKLAAVKWQELYAANKVTSFLGLTLMLGMVQALRTKLEEVLRDESLVQRYKNCGWISDGVAFLRVEPGRKEGVPVDNPAAPPHQDSADAGGDGKKSSPAGGAAQVPGHEGHHPGCGRREPRKFSKRSGSSRETR